CRIVGWRNGQAFNVVATLGKKASGYGRDEVKRNTEIFRGQIIDVTPSLYTVQLAGTSDKLDAFLASIRDVAKIVEVARSGVVGLSRGDKIMR
ncbi:acetolactate synthase small subunit, partial [Escherichia sp. TWPC-MK]